MSKVKFANIAPYSAMKIAESKSQINLVLAHLVGDNEYTRFYAESKKETIIDNGAFELGESLSPELLIDKARLVNADYIVLPDYPGQPFNKTIDAAIEYIPKFKAAGFKTFFAPQSEAGDFDGYMTAWDWALNNEDIDLIGCSILGAPKALAGQDRLIARFIILRFLAQEFDHKLLEKRIHMLGMLDSVHEICLTKPFHFMINSWDSSAAVWSGMNDMDVAKQSYKYTKEVDFDAPLNNEKLVLQNMAYIKQLIK